MTDETEGQSNAQTQHLLKEHPALFVSGIYVFASAIGMFYSWDFLRRFGINVFHYAEIGDFLLASLKEPYTWALVFGAILLVTFDNLMSRKVEAKANAGWWAWYGTRRYRSINYLVAFLMVIIFLDAYVLFKAGDIRAGEGEIVTVSLTDASPRKERLLLGTTGRFIFLYDHTKNRVQIHPHESILTITKSVPDGNDTR